MARPQIYHDNTVVALSSGRAANTLQARSERRAIVNLIIDNGGRMTLAAIDEHFGYDIRAQVQSLVRSNWLAVVDSVAFSGQIPLGPGDEV